MRYFWTAVLMLGGPALALEQATFKFLGFSQNGQYAAYEQYGYQDGSGFPYSEIMVVQVPKNQVVKRVYNSFDLTDEGAQQTIRDQALVNANLGQYGIKATNAGKVVYSSKLGTIQAKFSLNKVAHQMRVQAVGFPTSECLSEGARGFQFFVNQKSIYKDARLPEARACAQQYGIFQVRVWNNNFVAFLRYERDGFEGPDTRYWPVGGKLP